MAFPPRFGMPSIAQATFVPTYNAVPVVLPTTAHYLMPTLANSGVVRNVVQKTPSPAPLTKRQEILMEKPPVTTVFVGNINEQATNEMIKAMLVKCGNIISWKRIQGPNGKFQAFGFCEYDHPDSTLRALRLLHDWPLGDKKLVLKCDEKNKSMLIDFINKRRSLYNKPPLKMEGDQLPADDEIRKEDEMFRKALKNLVKEMAPELFEGTSKSHVPKSPTLTGKGGNLDIESLDRDRKEYIAKEIIQFREAHKMLYLRYSFCYILHCAHHNLPVIATSFFFAEFLRENGIRRVLNCTDYDDKEARLKGKSASVDVNEKNERFTERPSTPLEADRRASTKFERNCATDSADAKAGEARGRRRGSTPETGSRRRRSPSADRLLETSEDAREREKLERKAREKEKNYLERLEKLEAREKRKAKERLKQAEKEKRRKKEQLADIKIMQEFLEDYIDEEGDLEFYQGKSLLLRKDAITDEMEWDALDRLREAEEIALIRRKLIEENSSKDSNETKIMVEELPVNPVKLEEQQRTVSESETDKAADNNDNNADEVDSAVPKVKKETVLIPTVFLPAQAENSQPIGFAGLKLGSVSTSTNTAAPIPLQQMFNEPDEEFSVVKTSSRKLVPLEYTEEEKRALEMPNLHTQMSTEERKKYVKSLIDKIPSSKEELFKYEIHWEYVDQLLIDRRIKPWISKKIIEYIGEEEASLVDFISEKVLERSTPQGLLDDISMVLDEEAGVFVAKLWRLLIYEIEAKRVDFYYDVLFELTVFPDSVRPTSGMIMLIVRCYSGENLLTYSFPRSTILIYRPWPWRLIRMFVKLPLYVFGCCNEEQTFMMDNFLFDNPEPCPGLYCGRQVIADGNYTECGVMLKANCIYLLACDWGTRVNERGICVPCNGYPDVYDWLYLGFMGFLPFLLHCASIKFTSAQTREFRNVVLPQIAAAFVECVFPAILSLLIVEPKGSLNFYTCGVQNLQDWYPVFYNPVIDYTRTVHCTQEAVYPLYFLPFVYYLFSLLSLSIIHPIVVFVFKLKKEGASGAIYAALYFYPILIILHSVLCGLIYYAFPYIILFAAICLNAMHLALYETQTPFCILHDMWRKKQNLAVLGVLIYLYLYGILSISRFSSYWVYNVMLLFIPAPSIFYVLTVKFTHPHRLNMII
ncbi:JNK1/MAPK8-associated membrane protein [Trichinella spiralis]|uniref:JNK1/MAPK8-associated membrane protein n=1 Tax=Trichinella spiralis TaxID=6334 RepID=A0A0V1BFR0_TRISP|nr:JNK1/MAPK8-associated membrane protein [Trichinella spiralis]